MKKEKVKKVDTNEENIKLDESKFKRKFKFFKNLVIFFEALLLIPGIIMILMSFIIGGEILIFGTKEFAKSIIIEDMPEESLTGIEIESDDLVGFAEELSGAELELEEETDEYKKLVAISHLVATAISYVCMIIMVDSLAKIFTNIEKNETPFIKENIKNLNKINGFALILFVFGVPKFSIGLLSLIIIAAITYIFKYGYKIQQEVDETL